MLFFLFIDINECNSTDSTCEQLCVNTIGSFHCGCLQGFILSTDNTTCTGKH